jgi:CheY-like chemotaxis protein
MVVDDEPDIRLLMRLSLERAGHTVLEAADGSVALAMLTESDVDLVLLDLRMPNIDGFGVLERLSESGRPKPLIVACSAHADPGTVARALEAGCAAYLSKPFDPRQLEDVVASTLR